MEAFVDLMTVPIDKALVELRRLAKEHKQVIQQLEESEQEYKSLKKRLKDMKRGKHDNKYQRNVLGYLASFGFALLAGCGAFAVLVVLELGLRLLFTFPEIASIIPYVAGVIVFLYVLLDHYFEYRKLHKLSKPSSLEIQSIENEVEAVQSEIDRCQLEINRIVEFMNHRMPKVVRKDYRVFVKSNVAPEPSVDDIKSYTDIQLYVEDMYKVCMNDGIAWEQVANERYSTHKEEMHEMKRKGETKRRRQEEKTPQKKKNQERSMTDSDAPSAAKRESSKKVRNLFQNTDGHVGRKDE